MTLPQPGAGVEIHSLPPAACRAANRSKNVTPGSTSAYPKVASSSRTRFMRFRSRTTLPRRTGADPPYARLRPVEIGHNGIP